jgi:thioesterase domain-containing protein
LGGSSWLAVRLFSEIEGATGMPVPLRMLVEAGTVEQLAEKLRHQREPAPWSPLVPIQSKGTKPPFFCVHGAGGHILLFEKVARHLGLDQPFFAFQAQGIEEGQQPLKHVEEMAALYVKTLREFQPTGPYYLGGYSMGGMVAFEMARQLHAQAQHVALVAIIDVPAQSPQLHRVRQFADLLGALLRMNADEREQLFLRIRHYLFRLSFFWRLAFPAKITYVKGKLGLFRQKVARANSKQDEAQRTNAGDLPTESSVDAQAKKRIRNLYIVNDQAFRAYVPRPYQGRVAVIRSERGYTGDADKDYSPDPTLGWRRVLSGVVETYEVPGNHNEMIREPYVRLLAEHLRASFDHAQRQLKDAGTH